LWQYLSAYSYFKPIAPEDMEEPLRLEGIATNSLRLDAAPTHPRSIVSACPCTDESLAFGDDPLDLEVAEGFQDASASSSAVPGNSKKRMLDDSVAAIREQDDFFKEVGAL
jgi:hypothetical protein